MTRGMASPSAKEGEKIRVLAASNCPAKLTFLQRAIRSASDIVVVGAAFDGWDAIAEYVGRAPAIVAVDALLPGVENMEAKQRAEAGLSDMRVIFLDVGPPDSRPACRSESDASRPEDRPASELLTIIRVLAAKTVALVSWGGADAARNPGRLQRRQRLVGR